MTPVPKITLRSTVEADKDAIELLLNTGFGVSHDPEESAAEFDLFPMTSGIGAFDGDRLIGYTAGRPQTVTVPGEQSLEVASIANVAVAPTYRRRGVLRALYTEQHRRIEAAGLPLTIFTASQGGIYGRFGYAPAVVEHRVAIDRRFAQFLPSTPDPGGVDIVPVSVVRQQIPEIYQRWQRLTPGAQQRPETSWLLRFDDIPYSRRNGGGELFAFTHADGYALYRFRRHPTGNTVELVELRAVTAAAHAGLWRALLAVELFDTVEATLAPGDALPYLLTDPRVVRTIGRYDGLWLRMMDVPAALSARGYRADLTAVLAVTDPFRDAGGSFALRIRDGVARCTPTTREPDIELGIDVLAGLYLGAHRAASFAASNRLRTKDSGLLRTLDIAFGADRDAVLGWFF